MRAAESLSDAPLVCIANATEDRSTAALMRSPFFFAVKLSDEILHYEYSIIDQGPLEYIGQMFSKEVLCFFFFFFFGT
jgi:hypothetical protein